VIRWHARFWGQERGCVRQPMGSHPKARQQTLIAPSSKVEEPIDTLTTVHQRENQIRTAIRADIYIIAFVMDTHTHTHTRTHTRTQTHTNTHTHTHTHTQPHTPTVSKSASECGYEHGGRRREKPSGGTFLHGSLEDLVVSLPPRPTSLSVLTCTSASYCMYMYNQLG